jgi:hypothetical protein
MPMDQQLVLLVGMVLIHVVCWVGCSRYRNICTGPRVRT